MKILILTVGLPRSGKTTWAKQQNHPIVNPDSIRLALHGQRFFGPAEPFVWAVAHAMVDSLFLAGHETVILDATNTTRKRRDEWKSSKYKRRYHVLDRTLYECLGQAVIEGDAEILPIIQKMSDQYDIVGQDEIDS
jgi:predicted kinase